MPVSNWRITGGYAFTAAEYVDFPTSATTNLAGNTPVFAPRHTLNLWTAYDWPSGLGVNLGVRALSSQFGDTGNVFRIDGYGMVNVGVRYQQRAARYALNVNNLTSTDYIASTLYDSQVYPGEPINVLGTLRVRSAEPALRSRVRGAGPVREVPPHEAVGSSSVNAPHWITGVGGCTSATRRRSPRTRTGRTPSHGR